MRPTNFRIQLPTLAAADQERIDTLAAHFVEGSDELLGLSSALTLAVKQYIHKDSERRREAAVFARNVRYGRE